MEESAAPLEPKEEEAAETTPEAGSDPVKEISLEQEVLSLKAALSQKSDEVQIAQEKHLRACAELENYKKRAARDQVELLRYANEKLLKELLPVVDNLDRAMTHMKATPEMSNWIEGVELTHRQCMDVLKKFGVTPIVSIGEPFDPSRHQAVAYLETHEPPENHVAEELQKGYLFHERVLRPAMVAVARKPAPAAGPEEDAAEKQEGRPDSQDADSTVE